MTLRITLDAADPARRERLGRLLADAALVVVPDGGDADVRLVDGAPSAVAPRVAGAPPALILTDQPAVAADPAVAGVLRRAATAATVRAALQAVAAGLQVRERARSEPPGFAAAQEDAPASLTGRELQILGAIGDGLSNKAVARRLGISAHTVKFHLEAVFAKLEVTTRAEAVAKGLRRGLIEL